MEFNEKLQELRKQKGLTQEELAQALFVSRTAVSKWESGRGYPNIDSLKAIARYFSVTIDVLLTGDEVLNLAEEDHKRREKHIRDLVYGLLDCSIAMLFFLPFFGQRVDGAVMAVSLIALNGIAPFLRIAFFAIVIGMTGLGILSLAFQNFPSPLWERGKIQMSLLLNGVGMLLFIISLQPYAATLLFVFLIIKLLMRIRWP